MTTKAMSLVLVYMIVTSPVGRHSQPQKETNTECETALAQSPWEANTRPHLDSFKHILVISITEDHWEDRGPHRYSVHHFKAKVIRAYKGDWKIGEKIAIVHEVDSPALKTKNAAAGHLVYVFTNKHTGSEIFLDTGEFGNYMPDME